MRSLRVGALKRPFIFTAVGEAAEAQCLFGPFYVFACHLCAVSCRVVFGTIHPMDGLVRVCVCAWLCCVARDLWAVARPPDRVVGG